jgi:hypothetical protein
VSQDAHGECSRCNCQHKRGGPHAFDIAYAFRRTAIVTLVHNRESLPFVHEYFFHLVARALAGEHVAAPMGAFALCGLAAGRAHLPHNGSSLSVHVRFAFSHSRAAITPAVHVPALTHRASPSRSLPRHSLPRARSIAPFVRHIDFQTDRESRRGYCDTNTA